MNIPKLVLPLTPEAFSKKAKKKDRILMFGTKAPGGMDMLVQLYLDSRINEEYPIKYIPTHIETYAVFKILYFMWSVLKAVPYMMNRRYKIAHMHVSKGGSISRKYVLAKLANLFGMTVIYHMHGGEFFGIYENGNDSKRRFIHKMLNLADKIIVLSNIRKKEYSRITDSNKLEIVYNFSEEPYIKMKKHNNINVVFIGRLGHIKGTDTLIAAAKQLNDLSFNLQIWGDGPEDKYRKLVRDSGLSKKAKVLGWLKHDRVDDILSTTDIYVQPSYFEDLPLSIIEALSHKLPVVSTSVGGIPEQVKNGYNGFLVEPGDVDGLAKALRTLITDGKKRRLFGNRSFKVYKEKFSKEKVEEQIIHLYGMLSDEIKNQHI